MFEKSMDKFLKKKIFQKKYRGFSLLEVMLAMFIFVLMITATTSIFVSAFHARNSARESQKSTEEARTAMETVAKNIRMSTELESITDGVKMFNNSQGKCIAYVCSGGKFQSKIYDPSDFDGDPNYPTCDDPVAFDLTLLSTGADVAFDVTETDLTSKIVGKATVRMRITAGGTKSVMQTTVSFRDLTFREVN